MSCILQPCGSSPLSVRCGSLLRAETRRCARGASRRTPGRGRLLSRDARERRRGCGRCVPRSGSISSSTSASLTVMFSRRATSSSTSALLTASAAASPLLVAELFPVDVRPHRVHLLLDQAADELLDAAVDLALQQRRRHIDAHARGQLLQQLAAHLALVLVHRLVLEIGAHALAERRRGSRSCRGPSRTRRRARARRACGSPSPRRRTSPCPGQFLDRVVVGITHVERLAIAGVQPDERLVEARRVRGARRCRR